MKYPLTLTFKLLALAPQIRVMDADGNLVLYVKQKLFKLKEDVRVFTDQTQKQEVYQIQANRILDFSAAYQIRDCEGKYLGTVRRKGLPSIWRASYEVCDGDQILAKISEENPWVKFLDTVFGQIPLLGIFSGYVFNPSYTLTNNEGELIARCKKLPAFLESKFQLSLLQEVDAITEVRIVLSFLMMTLLERMRG